MPNQSLINIVLVNPDIPGNTGSIGRTCVALGMRLILIKPYGFEITEKALRRAGLDYWKHVNLTEYDSVEDFFEGFGLELQRAKTQVWSATRGPCPEELQPLWEPQGITLVGIPLAAPCLSMDCRDWGSGG